MAFPIPQLSDLTGMPLHRVIASSYPPIDLFEDVASVEEFEVAIEYESITSDRVTDELGKIRQFAQADLLFGPGSTPVMAAFAYPNQYARFNTPERGAYYASDSIGGALTEHSHHWLTGFIQDAAISESSEPLMTVREYRNTLNRPLHDIRDRRTYGFAFDDDDYTLSQHLADTLRDNENSDGLLYQSLRCNAICIAAFKPITVTRCTQGTHFAYSVKNGQISIKQITAI